jgi:nucleotide-binding universal stress UspA family protein
MKDSISNARHGSGRETISHAKKRFLVPIDFSASSLQVLAYAVRLAELVNGSIIALAVVDLSFQPLPNVPASCPSLQEDLVEEAEAKLKRFVDAFPRSVEIASAVRMGLPCEAICQFAIEKDCALILFAKHEHRWWQRPFARHTVDRVFEKAPCFVQIVELGSDSKTPSIPENWLMCKTPPGQRAATKI